MVHRVDRRFCLVESALQIGSPFLAEQFHRPGTHKSDSRRTVAPTVEPPRLHEEFWWFLTVLAGKALVVVVPEFSEIRPRSFHRVKECVLIAHGLPCQCVQPWPVELPCCLHERQRDAGIAMRQATESANVLPVRTPCNALG